MTIDEIIQSIQIIKAQAEWDYPIDWQIVLDGAIETMRKYQMMQADYKARLKADLVAMLTEIQMEIEECVDGAEGSPQFEQGVTIARVQVVEIIQQKINELKAESEG